MAVQTLKLDVGNDQNSILLGGLFDAAHDAIAVVGEDGSVLFWNRQASKLFGWSTGEMIGQKFIRMVLPQEIDQNGQRNPLGFLNGEVDAPMPTQGIKVPVVRRDGSLFTVELTATPIALTGGRAFGAFIRDVTVDKTAEDRLHENEASLAIAKAQFVFAIEALDAGFAMFDRDERLVICNSKYREIYKAAADDIVPGVRHEQIPWFKVLSQGGEATASECDDASSNVTQRDHKIGDVWIRVNDHRTEDGGFVSLHTDITALKQQQHELRVARDAADAANRAKSEFLANMSHEIRTPMTAILGYADMLLSEGDIADAPPQRIEAIETIRRNGHHLLEILNDILDISKIEAGRMALETMEVDLPALLRDVYNLMKVKADAQKLTLELAVQTPIPARIKSDPTRLKQILLNLVGNAVKFTDQGTVRLEAAVLDGQLRLSIHDSGIGMTTAQMARLFRPFTQADASMNRKFGGTGLGLTISRHFARLLGGDLTVTSESDKGSCFTAVIDPGPLEGVPTIDTLLVRPTAITSASTSDTGKPLAGVRILLAEDGPDNQKLITFVLGKFGAESAVAGNGRSAIELYEDSIANGRPFDCILMDMQMPELDGYEATALLRQSGHKVPIIALTAHAMSGDREKCISAGCSDYATKPVQRASLLLQIQAALGHTCPISNAA